MKLTNAIRQLAITSLALTLMVALSADGFAQSKSRNGSSSRQPAATTKMAPKEMAAAKIGLEGYCPVCVLNGDWVKGKQEYSAKYDGVTYYFPKDEVKQMFQKDPAKYVPALGGDCTVCLVKAGKRVAGNVKFASLHDNRLYLFPGEKQRQMFNKNPKQFANVDLAIDGKCIVCKVKGGKEVDGKKEFTAVHKGMRYQFPSDSERQMFVSSPADFVSDTMSSGSGSKSKDGSRSSNGGSASRAEGKTGSGRRN